jgi:hypothetical protein
MRPTTTELDHTAALISTSRYPHQRWTTIPSSLRRTSGRSSGSTCSVA